MNEELYLGEWENEPQKWYPWDDEDELIAQGLYAAGDSGDPDDHPPTYEEDPSFYA